MWLIQGMDDSSEKQEEREMAENRGCSLTHRQTYAEVQYSDHDGEHQEYQFWRLVKSIGLMHQILTSPTDGDDPGQEEGYLHPTEQLIDHLHQGASVARGAKVSESSCRL